MNIEEAIALGVDLDCVKTPTEEENALRETLKIRKKYGAFQDDRRVVDRIAEVVKRLSEKESI